MAVPFIGWLGVAAGGLAAAGVWEARAHRRTLERIPLRIHVNGTRGKTSVTRLIAGLLRHFRRPTVAKCTGTTPVWIGLDGRERPWPRRGPARVHEQRNFLRRAARLRAEAAVVECMAVDPALQWIAEHELVRAHIGVITNVRRDHLEEMGSNLEQIARSLANTIPRGGVLVTGDARFAPLFERLAAPLGTRVLLARPREAATTPLRGAEAENIAVAWEVVRQAGFDDAAIAAAMPQVLRASPHRPPRRTSLPPPARDAVWVHGWAVNDTDSFEAYVTQGDFPLWLPLFNHRADRPLRTLDFGRVLAAHAPPRILVTGQAGAERLLRRAGIPNRLLRRVPFPPTPDAVATAVADIAGPLAVVGCGNARGLETWTDGPTADLETETWTDGPTANLEAETRTDGPPADLEAETRTDGPTAKRRSETDASESPSGQRRETEAAP